MRAAMVFLAMLLSSQLAAADGSVVTVRNLAQPGAFAIDNRGDEAVDLATEVIVEREIDGRWTQANIRFLDLTESCAEPLPACRQLAAGASLTPLPWNGYTCSGQCQRSCRSNRYAGPGTFRIVVHRCDRKERYLSSGFTMPPRQ